MFAMTWSRHNTPSGLSLSRLVVSALPTTANGFSSWPTPTTRDHKDGLCDTGNTPENSLLGRTCWLANSDAPVRLTVDGQTLTGSDAVTGDGVQLNPDLNRWLMGYPEEWARSAPGYEDWRKWQDLMAQASSEPKPTE